MKLMIDIPKNLYKATINGLDANEIWDLRLSVKNGTPLEQEPCENTISRQTVLDGLASIAKAKAKSDAQKSLIGRVMFLVEQMPNAQPKTEWIPVSERLPEKNDIYVVWTSKGFGNHLSTSYYSVDDGWTIEVCAWKENGEPYKAESEDDICY